MGSLATPRDSGYRGGRPRDQEPGLASHPLAANSSPTAFMPQVATLLASVFSSLK